MASRWLASATALALCSAAQAATYYIDFEGGKDDAVGTSAEQAWKHCPGDAAAKDKAKEAVLAPGDTVLFKGGVVYQGEIAIKSSGEQGKPIVFDGNSGKFGMGRAIIDGSAPITGWKHLASAEEAKGNPKWKEIFCADVPGPADWRSFNLSTEEKSLPVAQDPKMRDPFFQETVSQFHEAPGRMEASFPGQVYFEPGTKGNAQTPLFGVISGQPAVVQPIVGGAFTVELNEAVTVKAVGIKPQPNYPAVKDVEFLGDGKSLLKATLERNAKDIQKFDLPEAVKVKKLTFKLLSAYEGEKGDWTKIARVAAWTAEGKNVLDAGEVQTIITDTKVLTQTDPHYCDGMWVGVHGGNNWVTFEEVRRFDPAAHRLYISFFADVTYKTTKYSFFNSVRLIDRPGEYSVEPTADKKTYRVFLLPEKVQGDQPAPVGCSVRLHGITLTGASHVVLRGLVVRRQGRGAASGISAKGGSDLTFADCEVAGVQGSPGLGVDNADGVVVERCYVHHCGGPDCRGMVLYKCTHASTRFCRIVKNTGTAVDYYGCADSECRDNFVSDSRGMHANGLTFYVGNKNIVVERNVVVNSNIGLTIQEAENVVIRNNLFDSGGRSMCVGIWPVPLRNVQFLNNTFVRSEANTNWTAAIFSNSTKAEELVFRNNIIDGTSGNLPGTYDHNLYTRQGPNEKTRKLGTGEFLDTDLTKTFVDPEKGDFHLKAGSPAIGAGAEAGVKDDLAGTQRPEGRASDIGAYQYK